MPPTRCARENRKQLAPRAYTADRLRNLDAEARAPLTSPQRENPLRRAIRLPIPWGHPRRALHDRQFFPSAYVGGEIIHQSPAAAVNFEAVTFRQRINSAELKDTLR